MYNPQTILSKNTKCGVSLNLPIKGHCRPTQNCAHDCYAKSGHCIWPASLRKQLWVSKYLESNNISRLITESRIYSSVRLSGTGDLKLSHIPNIIKMAKTCKETMFWGMTRKTEIAKAVNKAGLNNLKLLVTVDATTPKSVWKYQGAMCFGPRRPKDVIPNDSRIKTVFPRHSAGRVVNGVDHHKKDCKAVWHEISGCTECGQCWKW